MSSIAESVRRRFYHLSPRDRVPCRGTGSRTLPRIGRICTSDDTFMFGNRAVGSSTTANATVTNCGDAPWSFTNVSVHPATGPAFQVSTTCTTGLTLAPGETCTVSVRFALHDARTDVRRLMVAQHHHHARSAHYVLRPRRRRDKMAARRWHSFPPAPISRPRPSEPNRCRLP